MLRSIGKQSGESACTCCTCNFLKKKVEKKKKKASLGRICGKWKVLSLE